MTAAPIHYAPTADGRYIAYQTVGDGPRDLLFLPEWVSHLELAWEWPPLAEALTRLSSFGRLIWFDKLGTGLSDPIGDADLPTLEAWMDDTDVVLRAAGAERPAVLGTGFGAMMAILYAASRPERVRSLAAFNAFARTARATDYPAGMPESVRDWMLTTIASGWGRGAFDTVVAPDGGEPFRQWFARYQRGAASPGVALRLTRAFFDTDVRAVLPVLRIPSLIVHRRDNQWARVGHGRYLAEHIAGARFVELPGRDHFFAGADDAALDEIEEAFTAGDQLVEPDSRLLATVLFVDIVDSTARAAALGDREWRARLARYHAVARGATQRHRGREIGTAGAGFFAAFDGPGRAIRCACAIRAGVAALGLRVRAGLHTGECERLGDSLTGIAVHVGTRIAATAEPDEVLVSSTVRDLVAGAGLRFSPRGTQVLRGVPGEWPLFRLEPSA